MQINLLKINLLKINHALTLKKCELDCPCGSITCAFFMIYLLTAIKTADIKCYDLKDNLNELQ